ncbi:MAG: AAA family ATPase [Acidimicrobiales bacterium]|nr:AAA family ATPase [Acidimicrobiales bacterium]
MRIDLGLEVSVREFMRVLVPIVEGIVARAPNGDVDAIAGDVALEAFNLACGFIDADGLATDDELAALLQTFAPLIDESFARTTPTAARRAGLTQGKRAFLSAPSTLFEILLGVDEREGTNYSTTYYEHAMALGHMVASLDTHTSRTELLAIEDFRSMLLRRIKSARPSSAAVAHPTRDDRREPGAPARASQGPTTPGEQSSSEPLPPPRPLDELLAELDDLVGMADVKREVVLVTNLIRVQNLRRQRDLPVLESSRHLVFTGNPGTGKTTVARLLAEIFRTLEVVERGQLVETDRAGLVAGYVGQTALKVQEVFDRADGGVLLIDEAYALARGSDNDFGREAIDTIVKLVEDRRDRTVVIVAGYPDEMQLFLDTNPGLRSRFPKTIAFPDYSTEELVQIFEAIAAKAHYKLHGAARDKVRDWLAAVPRHKGFGNGRLARNLFEEAAARQASRIVSLDDPTDDDLVTLTATDIPDVGEGPLHR